jgi:hypothetical protein
MAGSSESKLLSTPILSSVRLNNTATCITDTVAAYRQYNILPLLRLPGNRPVIFHALRPTGSSGPPASRSNPGGARLLPPSLLLRLGTGNEAP